MGLRSSALILRRVAEPVESFGFKFLQSDLPPPLLDGKPDRLGKLRGLFDQMEEGPADELQGVHRCFSRQPISSGMSTGLARKGSPPIRPPREETSALVTAAVRNTTGTLLSFGLA